METAMVFVFFWPWGLRVWGIWFRDLGFSVESSGTWGLVFRVWGLGV